MRLWQTFNVDGDGATDTAAEMALLTMIARVIDGLPLVGTMQDDEQVSSTSIETHNNNEMGKNSETRFHFHFTDWTQHTGLPKPG